MPRATRPAQQTRIPDIGAIESQSQKRVNRTRILYLPLPSADSFSVKIMKKEILQIGAIAKKIYTGL